MIQTIENQMQRLFWRLGGGKAFTPNQNDIDAITFVAKWINREKEQRINENHHFCKIAIYCYINELRFYRDTHLSEVKMQEVLEKPLEFWYERFRQEINTVDLSNSFDAIGIEYPYGDKNTIQAKLEANKACLIDNEVDILKSLEGYSYEQVRTRLNIYLTELLNIYGNL